MQNAMDHVFDGFFARGAQTQPSRSNVKFWVVVRASDVCVPATTSKATLHRWADVCSGSCRRSDSWSNNLLDGNVRAPWCRHNCRTCMVPPQSTLGYYGTWSARSPVNMKDRFGFQGDAEQCCQKRVESSVSSPTCASSSPSPTHHESPNFSGSKPERQ